MDKIWTPEASSNRHRHHLFTVNNPPVLRPRSKINKQAVPLFSDLCLTEVLFFDLLELLLPHHSYIWSPLHWLYTMLLAWGGFQQVTHYGIVVSGLAFMHYRNSFNHSLELLSSVAPRSPRTGFLTICFLASILYSHVTIANRATSCVLVSNNTRFIK